MSRPLQLPRLTNSETLALAALATQGPGHALTLPQGHQALLKLAPLPPGESCVQATGAQRLFIEWGGGQMALDIAPNALNNWVQLVLGAASLVELPSAFHQAALEHIVQWITSELDHVGRGQAHVLEFEAATHARPPSTPHTLALEFTIDGGISLPCLLHLDSLALMLVGSLVQLSPSSHEAQPMNDLPVPVHLCVGETSMPLSQLKTLQLGGLVLISQAHVQDDGLGVLLSTAIGPKRRWTVPGRIQDSHIFLIADPITMTTQTEPNNESGDQAISWNDMPVHVSFDVGHKMLTLGQLRQLCEGQALQLDRQIQSAVNIRANGALIGQGQLVDIDGQLGVLVNKLHSPSTQETE